MTARRTCASLVLLAVLCVQAALAAADDGILGSWKLTAYDQDGHAPPAELLAKMSVVIERDRIILKPRLIAEYKMTPGKKEAVFRLDETKADEIKFKLDKDKGWIDLIADADAKAIKGLYIRDDDALKICFPLAASMHFKTMREEYV